MPKIYLKVKHNIYMAAEVKRKYYPLRIGLFHFFLLPFFAIARIDLAALAAFRLIAFYSERQTNNTGRKISMARGLHQTSVLGF